MEYDAFEKTSRATCDGAAGRRPPAAPQPVSRLCLGILLALSCLAFVGQPHPARAEEKLLAFPGAEGYGRFAQGGRGGRVIAVTSLDDSGPGTLRACVEETGPRNCIFRVGGVIRLKSSIVASEANGSLSILGQTAPGDGITLTTDVANPDGKDTPLAIVRSHDVIVRHIRVRTRLPNTVKNVHAIVIEDSHDVYIDHTSTSWATDENISTYSNTSNLTIGDSIFAEGLNKHSKCTLLGADPRRPQNLTFMRNLCLSNRDRNPDNNHYAQSCIDIVNNVFFNAISEWGEVFSQFPGGTPISYVGNYFKAGPSTIETSYAITWQTVESVATPRIYESDNAVWAPKNKKLILLSPGTDKSIVSSPPCPLSVGNILSSTAAYQEVSNRSGAFPRDQLDRKWVEQLGVIGKGGSGRTTTVFGDLPQLQDGTPYEDRDGNGLADSVEATSGDWSKGPDGFSRFDLFMEWLSEERIAGRYPQ
jgi:pectate lyase